MSNNFTYEEELFYPIQKYLTNMGYKVKGEIGHCDIFAKKEDEVLVVELKKGLTIDLLIQSVKRQKIADKVFVAIPKPKINFYSKRWRDIKYLLRRLELGLFLVSKKDDRYSVKLVLEPSDFNVKKSKYSSRKKREKLVEEFNNRTNNINIGGSKGKKIITSYREEAIKVGSMIRENGPMKPVEFEKLGFKKNRVYSILYKNYYGWFDNIKRGLYNINSKGLIEIKEYELKLGIETFRED